MKAHLLWCDRDVDFTITAERGRFTVEGPELGVHDQALLEDLELDTVLAAMAAGDPVLFDIARRVIVGGLEDPAAILYRQEVLADCLRNESTVRRMLAVTAEAVAAEGRLSLWHRLPASVLRRSVEALELLVGMLRRLRGIAEEHGGGFSSEGFKGLFASLRHELSEEYFAEVDEHLERLRFSDGVTFSARLGPGLKRTSVVLRSAAPASIGLKERLHLEAQSEYHWNLPPRDEAGSRAISEMNDQAIALVASAASRSVVHITSFLVMAWIELGFYAACLNLAAALRETGQSCTFPEPADQGDFRLRFRGLRDTSLALRGSARVVGNDAEGDGKRLVMVTGANSGGKSTFLRSVGLAQVMMQAGMFVTADSYTASPARRMFTHFIRGEDPTLASGKLDEEMARMSSIADGLCPGALVLFNESFAATNEREGSAIAGGIIRALVHSGIRVVFVTHRFTLAEELSRDPPATALFLRAERRPDGTRTFKLVEGPPLRSGFGTDIYARIGGWDGSTTTAAGVQQGSATRSAGDPSGQVAKDGP